MDRTERRKLNTQTINSAAFASLSALAALVAFTVQSRSPGVGYGVLASASAAALIFSVIVGSRGVDRIAESHDFFEWQARLCLLGALLTAASMFVMGPTAEQRNREHIRELGVRVSRIEAHVDTLESATGVANHALQKVAGRVDSLTLRQSKEPRALAR